MRSFVDTFKQYNFIIGLLFYLNKYYEFDHYTYNVHIDNENLYRMVICIDDDNSIQFLSLQ